MTPLPLGDLRACASGGANSPRRAADPMSLVRCFQFDICTYLVYHAGRVVRAARRKP
jgi:hypothetical protein